MQSVQRFLRACLGEPVDRPPVWIMRQAGRTLPEYREVREHHGFWEICTTPELCAQVTIQPVRRFPLDAAIVFSDILTVPWAMGLELTFDPAPVMAPRVRTAADVDALHTPDVGRVLGFVGEGIRIARRELGPDLAVLGFSGAPFTLARYMVEGGASHGGTATLALLRDQPAVFERLLGRLADVCADYLVMQIEAGATAVQLFDTSAGELTPQQFGHFALPAIRRIFDRVASKGVPMIYFATGIGPLLAHANRTGATVLGIDWRVTLAEVRRQLGASRVLQGNLDPSALLLPEAEITRRVHTMLAETGGRGHIVNLGHGVLPQTPLGGIQAFVDAVVHWAETPA